MGEEIALVPIGKAFNKGRLIALLGSFVVLLGGAEEMLFPRWSSWFV